jgi:hypothetical protein
MEEDNEALSLARGLSRGRARFPQKKWGPALLPAPTAPSEGSAGVRNLVKTRRPRPALDPGSPAQASLPTEQLPPQGRSPINLLDCAARRFAGLSTVPAWHPNRSPSAKTARCSAALLGSTTPASRFAHQSNLHEEDRTGNRVALEKINSSGASSRLAPTRTRKLSPLPAGGDRNLGTYRPREARTAVPITQAPCTSAPSRKSKIFGNRPVDNGDIGSNRWNLLATALTALPFRRRRRHRTGRRQPSRPNRKGPRP